mmetsp:Transcript_15524/g.50887  ORF Transcript_15524/g.50887 Transcript_15524/m.50887 type:complete len:485 (-) Transcript_15524:2667-4121(-)
MIASSSCSLCLASLVPESSACMMTSFVAWALVAGVLALLLSGMRSRVFWRQKLQEDDMLRRVRSEAEAMVAKEPTMGRVLGRLFLDRRKCRSFEDVVAASVAARLADADRRGGTRMEEHLLFRKLKQAFDDKEARELGWPLYLSVRADCQAVVFRDPATESLVEVVAYFKGFAAIQAHRAARYYWQRGEKQFALWLQSRTSQVCGVDAHPACEIGSGVMFDHATGVVIGETAKIGDGCTLLHGVTLGASGKEKGDRHPKVGEHVLIGAGVSILGNVVVGDRAKIGAGAVVLRPIPSGATAVGAPARIVGRVKEEKPGELVDSGLTSVDLNEDSKDIGCVWREIARGAKSSKKNNVESIGIQDFIAAMAAYDVPENQIYDLFFHLDKDLDGLVSKSDLKQNFAGIVNKFLPANCPCAKKVKTMADTICAVIINHAPNSDFSRSCGAGAVAPTRKKGSPNNDDDGGGGPSSSSLRKSPSNMENATR